MKKKEESMQVTLANTNINSNVNQPQQQNTNLKNNANQIQQNQSTNTEKSKEEISRRKKSIIRLSGFASSLVALVS